MLFWLWYALHVKTRYYMPESTHRLCLGVSKPYLSASGLPRTASYGGFGADVTKKRALCVVVVFSKHHSRST
jgi:hypothetical protein